MSDGDGKWVQTYTRRGSPRQGKYRWKSAEEQREDTLMFVLAVVLALVGVGALIWKAVP